MRDAANEVGTISECSFYLGWLTFLAKKRNFWLTNLKCYQSLHWCKFPDENTDIFHSTQTECPPYHYAKPCSPDAPNRNLASRGTLPFYVCNLAIIEWGWVGYEEFCRSRRVLSTEAEGSEICRILHILRKPNSIIALLFIQNISSFLKEFHHYALWFSAHQI